MMYGTQTVITITPDQLTELMRGAVRQELANYIPPAPPSPTLPEYLTRRQTKEVLQRSFTTLNAWSKATDDRPALLVPLTLNGQVRYRRDDVLALLRESHRFKSKNS